MVIEKNDLFVGTVQGGAIIQKLGLWPHNEFVVPQMIVAGELPPQV